jgi:16S rRNA G966 N2-methylase RsmD
MSEKVVKVSESTAKRLFDCSTIDYKSLAFTNESIYSITPYKLANSITNYLFEIHYKKYDRYPNIIVDATANVGGNTISFSKRAEIVYSFEIKLTTANILLHNLRVNGISNVNVINDDFKKYINNLFLNDVDMVFIDPPWYIDNIPNKGMSIDYTNKSPIDEIIITIKNIKDILIAIKVPKKYTTKVPPIKCIQYKKLDVLVY